MKKRDIGYHVEWRKAWKGMREERIRKRTVSYDGEFFSKAAGDFSRRAKSNDYEFGRKSTEILGGILDSDIEVLEIGTGSGTLTVPLSEKVKHIAGVELSQTSINHLESNLRERSVKNVDIFKSDWREVDDDEIKGRYDLVACSHFLWQVEDIEELLTRMENASRGYCAVIQPSGRDRIAREVFEKLRNQEYAGQFDPDADYFAYVILREWGRLVTVGHFDYKFEWNLDEAIRYTAGLVGRYVEVDAAAEEKIKDYLLSMSPHGEFMVENNAVVMYWKPEK